MALLQETPLRQPDREQTRKRMGDIIIAGAEILEGSNLVKEGAPIGPQEVLQTRKFIQAVAPIDVATYRLYEHLQLASKFARQIGEDLIERNPQKYNKLNLDELEVLALLHDFGRFTTHRFYRNDIVGGLEFKAIGMRKDLTGKLPSIKDYVKKDPADEQLIDATFSNLSLEQRIIEAADVHGKRKDDGQILPFDEIMSYHRASRVQTGNELYPSERMKNPQFIQFCEKYMAVYVIGYK